MRILFSMAFLAGLAWAGCAHKPDGFSTQGFSQVPAASGTRPALPVSAQNLIMTPETTLVGRIVKVNTGGRFVVLNFPIGHLPALDQRMNVYHQGLKVGEVKVSGPQLDDNIVGDLVNGTASAGDDVREQ